MKKYLICSITILFISLSIFLYININTYINIKRNNKVINTFNNIFTSTNYEYASNLPKLQIDNIDYIGIINISKYNLILPIESICNNSIINIQSSCMYSYNDKSIIILGTNLFDSFNSYKKYVIDDTITITNMLGKSLEYKIKDIKRINSIKELSKYTNDLIIVIKNYYEMEYVLVICKLS